MCDWTDRWKKNSYWNTVLQRTALTASLLTKLTGTRICVFIRVGRTRLLHGRVLRSVRLMHRHELMVSRGWPREMVTVLFVNSNVACWLWIATCLGYWFADDVTVLFRIVQILVFGVCSYRCPGHGVIQLCICKSPSNMACVHRVYLYKSTLSDAALRVEWMAKYLPNFTTSVKTTSQ